VTLLQGSNPRPSANSLLISAKVMSRPAAWSRYVSPNLTIVDDVDALVDAVRTGLALPRLRRRFQPTLTGRQLEVLEVAALLARGISNRQIAERLVITERSTESHVERILARVGFRSRTQIATWYVATSA